MQPSSTDTGITPTIVFSLLTPSRSLRIVNLLINTFIFAACVDFVTYPFFDDASDVIYSRIGALYPDAAKVVVRYPSSDANTTYHEVYITWRQEMDNTGIDSWKEGSVVNLTKGDDWVGTVKLFGLSPSTSYECVLLSANCRLDASLIDLGQIGSKTPMGPCSLTPPHRSVSIHSQTRS